MEPRKKGEYIDSLWDDNDDNLLRLFFGRKVYFISQLDKEITKITNKDVFAENENVIYGRRKFEDMSLSEIGRIAPDIEKELRDNAFESARNSDGFYECAICKKTSRNRIPFQVDHIIPLNKGGKSVSENLQILCKRCNGLKGDNYIPSYSDSAMPANKSVRKNEKRKASIKKRLC